MSVFLRVVEWRKSKMQVLADLVPDESRLLFWLAATALFPVCLHGGESLTLPCFWGWVAEY
jgi:hypothetical protein